MAITRAFSRYYCTKDPRHRVFPYDSIDLDFGVEAPVVGKSGEVVLLSTLNANPVDGYKWGWCWACGMFVQCIRRTQHQINLEYTRRKGVTLRRNATAVATRQEERRAHRD